MQPIYLSICEYLIQDLQVPFKTFTTRDKDNNFLICFVLETFHEVTIIWNDTNKSGAIYDNTGQVIREFNTFLLFRNVLKRHKKADDINRQMYG
jgi:hypothetical protein